MLMDEEDDTPIKIRQQAPTKDLDEKLRMDAAKGERCSVVVVGAGRSSQCCVGCDVE